MKRAILIYQNQKFPYIYEAASENNVQIIAVNKPGEEYQQSYRAVIHSEILDIFSDPIGSEMAIIALAELYEASIIITCRDEAIPFTAMLSIKLGIQYVNPEGADNLRSKSKMRSMISSLEYCPHYIDVPNKDFLNELSDRFPLIIKPSSGYGSMGVTLVHTLQEASEIFEAISSMNEGLLNKECDSQGRKITGVLAEEYIDGEEYIVDSFSFNGVHKILSVASKGRIEGPTFEETYHASNPPLSNALVDEIYNCVSLTLTAVFHINGPSHMEIRIKDDRPYVIECAARIGGGGICHYLVKEGTGVDYMRLIIDLSEGDEEYFSELPLMPSYNASALNYNLRVGRDGGIYCGLRGINKLSKNSEFRRILYVAPKGKFFRPYPEFSGFPGFIQSSHANYSSALDFVRSIEKHINVDFEEK